jgi:hypothetical protein
MKAEREAAAQRIAAERAHRHALLGPDAAAGEGPGELRAAGSRHDNDFADFREIGIAPTPQELLAPENPYLPCNQ